MISPSDSRRRRVALVWVQIIVGGAALGALGGWLIGGWVAYVAAFVVGCVNGWLATRGRWV